MDLTPIFIWWLIAVIIGLIGWPLAFNLLRYLPDRGFAFAKAVGLLTSGYMLWLLGSFRLLKNNTGGIITVMLLLLVIGLLWHRERGDGLSMLAWLKKEWRYALSVELLFGLVFVGWAIFKSHNPNIETAGGEKWMEITFINGVLRSDYFPPQDPWLSGFAISYYYFGYVLMAMMTRLSGLVSTTAFNLYIPTLMAMTMTASFGIVANMVSLHRSQNRQDITNLLTFPALASGFMAAIFVAVLGNLQGLLELLHKRGLFSADFWAWLDIRDLKTPPPLFDGNWIPDRFYWWWRGSRVLTDYNLAGQEQEVIDEFPFFSFLLGDVHPHVLALPFVLLVVALALNLLVNNSSRTVEAEQNDKNNISTLDKLRKILQNSWGELQKAVGGRLAFVLYAVCLGGLSFLNTWDFPIYLGVMGLSIIVGLSYRYDWRDAIQTGFINTVMLGLAGIILYLPFYATFQSQAKGILPNLWNPTRLPHYFVFFAPFLVIAAAMLIILSVRYWGWQKNLIWSIPLTVLSPILVMLMVIGVLLLSEGGQSYINGIVHNSEIQQAIGGDSVGVLLKASLLRRLSTPWVFLLVGLFWGWGLALLVGSNKLPLTVKFALILLLIGFGLTMVVEFIYLRDNFGTRMNTVFKFYFQAWVLLALSSAFAFYYIASKLRGIAAIGWYAVIFLLVGGGMVYPVLATANKANNFQNKPTLDGIYWISEYHPADYAAIEWLRENATDGGIILEAPGAKHASYKYDARISALTGLPTLLGWGGHQSQWRGNYDEPASREPDIEALFNTVDPLHAKRLMDKYNISYVYVGQLERERYAPRGLDKFGKIMDIVFEQDGTIIYRRR